MQQLLFSNRENLTKQIRKRQRQLNIQSSRNRTINSLLNTHDHPLKSQEQLLLDKQKIISLTLLLHSDPNPTWVPIIEEIRKISEGHCDFNYFSQLMVLKQLSLVFRKQLLHLNLSTIAASLLNYILVSNTKDTFSIIKILIQQGLCQNLLQIIKTSQFLNDKIQQLCLIGNLVEESTYIRSLFVNEGWVQIIFNIEDNLNFSDKVREIAVWIISNMVISCHQNSHRFKDGFINKFLQTLAKYLDKNINDSTKKDILVGLYNIFKLTNTNLSITVASLKNICMKIVQQTESQNRDIRQLAWRLLIQFIKYSQNTLGVLVTKNNIHFLAYKTLSLTTDQRIQKLTYKFLIYLVRGCRQHSEALAQGPILKMILHGCSIVHNERTRQTNICLLKYIINEMSFCALQKILEEEDILEVIISNLSFGQSSVFIINQCIDILVRLICMFKDIYSPDDTNIIVLHLEKYYETSNILYQIINNYSNEEIIQKANILLNQFV